MAGFVSSACPTPLSPVSIMASSPKLTTPTAINTADMVITPTSISSPSKLSLPRRNSGMVLPPRHDSHRTDDCRIPVIVYPPHRQDIVVAIADVLGRRHRLADLLAPTSGIVTLEDQGSIVGISVAQAREHQIQHRDRELVVVFHARCVDDECADSHDDMAIACDFEFMYSESTFSRRMLAQFLALTLRQTMHHHAIPRQASSHALLVAGCDVPSVSARLDMATIGVDAIEMVVRPFDREYTRASLDVGRQLMVLRQSTDLPIILTVQAPQAGNDVDDSTIKSYCALLERAIQWGIEFVSVCVRIPELRRRTLFERRGNTCIITTVDKVSPSLTKSPAAFEQIYREACRYGDLARITAPVDFDAQATDMDQCHARVMATSCSTPLSIITRNETTDAVLYPRTRVLVPITHPLLPRSMRAGLSTLADLNAHDQQQPKTFFAMGDEAELSAPASVYQKVANELGLPHRFVSVQGSAEATRCLGAWSGRSDFGGAVMAPTVLGGDRRQNGSTTAAARLPKVVDTLVPSITRRGSPDESICPTMPPTPPETQGDCQPSMPGLQLKNITSSAIVRALTRETVPSAFSNRAALVLADVPAQGLPAIRALLSLGASEIYTFGFAAPGCHELPEPWFVERLLQQNGTSSPFTIVSAGHRRVGQLLLQKVADASCQAPRRVVLEIGPGASCEHLTPGVVNLFGAGTGMDVAACVVSETMRELMGQSVPVGFARAAMQMCLC